MDEITQLLQKSSKRIASFWMNVSQYDECTNKRAGAK